ncbi:hypothetical protein BH20ACI4_BH20ACI4_20760 [soil metagenome]
MPRKYSSSYHPKSDRVVDSLRSAIVDTGLGLADVPELLKQVIVEELWRARENSQGKNKIIFADFTDFVRAKAPEGLGYGIPTLKKLCRDNAQTLELLAKVSRRRSHGGDRRSENFKFNNFKFEKPATGNSSQYGLDRLRRMRPDLHPAVLFRKHSINCAMIKAGFRKEKIQLQLNVFSFAKFINKKFSRAEILKLIELLSR